MLDLVGALLADERQQARLHGGERSDASASVAPTIVLKFDDARDLGEVAAERVAVPAQDLALAVELLERAREVRVRGVLRRDLERHLLAAAGDPERDAAVLQRQRPHDRAVDLVVRRRRGWPRRSSRPAA